MSSPRPDLVVAPCSHAAAEYAVKHWHYSQKMPVGKLARFGAWEGGRYIGAVLFGWGANKSLGSPYGLGMTECAELVRVALTDHAAPVSQIVSKAIKGLRRSSPGLRLLVSFADPYHGHNGGIYQAMNWVYLGTTADKTDFISGGVVLNRRAFTGGNFGTPRLTLPPDAVPFRSPGKHRYLYPLDDAMRAQLAPLAKPYPKRASEPTSVGAGDQPVQGGATPTRTLEDGAAP